MDEPASSGSRFWRLFFRGLFSTAPLFRAIRKRRPLPPIEELAVAGRRSGIERRFLVQLIEADGHTYVGEPSGISSDWTRNLAAAGHATLIYRDGRRVPVAIEQLARGAERKAAVDAQPVAQPAPMRFLYRRARRHIDAVGTFFRLDPTNG